MLNLILLPFIFRITDTVFPMRLSQFYNLKCFILEFVIIKEYIKLKKTYLMLIFYGILFFSREHNHLKKKETEFL